MGSSTPNTYLSVQILDEVLKKKESYKQHCQAEALCKFDCCRPMNLLYVDLDIVHHLDSAILIFRPCHWHLPCWYHPDSVILIFHPCHWHLSYWYHPDSAILIFHRCHQYLPYWCHQCHQLVFSSGINIPIVITAFKFVLFCHLLVSRTESYFRKEAYRFGWQFLWLTVVSQFLSPCWYWYPLLFDALLMIRCSYLR